MKVVTIGLVVTCVALGGIGAYLFERLNGERQRVDAEVALRLELESRMKQLELAASESASDGATEVADAVVSGANAAVGAMAPTAADPEASAEPAPGVVRLARRQFNPYDMPGGREMMRLQGRMSSKRMYADLLKQLNLDAQQSQQFMNLLVDQQEREMQAYQQLGGDRAGINQTRKDLQTQAQAEVASLFGAQKAEAFAKYQATIGERLQVGQMAEQLEALELPMNDNQKEQLIAVMVEEKTSFPEPDTNYRDPESRNAHVDWYEQYNRSVLSRASSILSLDQHRQLSDIQEWQMSTQRMFNERRTRARPRASRE